MSNQQNQNNEQEVLFQKLGNTWYVFSLAGEELIFTALPEGMDPNTDQYELYEVLEEHFEKVGIQRSPEAAA